MSNQFCLDIYMRYRNLDRLEYYIGKILALAGILVFSFFCFKYFTNRVEINRDQNNQKTLEEKRENLLAYLQIKVYLYCSNDLLNPECMTPTKLYLESLEEYNYELEEIDNSLESLYKKEENLNLNNNLYNIGITGSISITTLGLVLIIGRSLFMSISQRGNFGIGVNDGKMLGNAIGISNAVNNVNNAIDKLSKDTRQLELKELLNQLQEVIITENGLGNEDKIEALDQVRLLAELKKDCPDNVTFRRMSRTAVKILKGTVSDLPTKTKTIENTNKLLSEIVKLLEI